MNDHSEEETGAATIEHVIFTPFCISKYGEWKAGIGKPKPVRQDPLAPPYVEYRLRYLESICFPSISEQVNQDFTWILAIDPELPERFVKPLDAMIASRPGSFLHRVHDARLEQFDWIRPYLSSQRSPSRLITTNLDSDDGLDRNFTRGVQKIVLARSTGDSAPPILVLGFRDCIEWDLIRSWSAPFGRARWYRGRGTRLRSAGYSVAAHLPNYPALVTGVRHWVANSILDFSIDDPAANSAYSLRRHLCELAEQHGQDLSSWSIGETLEILDGRVGPSLMLNHEHNVQDRLGERKLGRRRVWGRRSLPDVPVDWDKLWGS